MRRSLKRLLGLAALSGLLMAYGNCSQFVGFSTEDMDFSSEALSFEVGAKLYTQNCAYCHSSLDRSSKQDRSAAQIRAAISAVPAMAAIPGIANLTRSQIEAIASALRTTTSDPNGNPFLCQPGSKPGGSRLQRLAKSEYVNTLRDLLGGVVPMSELSSDLALIPEEANQANMFDRGADSMNLGLVRAQNRVASSLASRLTGDSARLNTVFSEQCLSQSTVTDACLNSFLDRFGTRVFRRPVKATERGPLIAAYRLGTNRAESSGYLLRALLMSPAFLYHLETDGTPADNPMTSIQLNPYELASRISYLAVNSMPDSELLAAAANGSLQRREVLDAQIQRLFSKTEARASLRRFFYLWFDLNHLRSPAYTNAFKSNIDTTNINSLAVEESMLFVDHVIFEGKKLESLLTDTTAFIKSPELAKIYGINLPGAPDGRTSLASNQRAGLLTRVAASLSGNDSTSPILRGVAMRRSLLCATLSAPDPNSLPAGALNPPPDDPTLSTRARYEAKTSPAQCMTCHSQINPFGFALENYDSLGRYRTIERLTLSNGAVAEHPIDSKATVSLTPGEITVYDGVHLSKTLSEDQKFYSCFSRRWFQFVYRRMPTSSDNCVMAATFDSVRKSDGTLLDAIKATILHPEFSIRRVN